MRKSMSVFIAAAVAAVFCGCASVEVAPVSKLHHQQLGYSGQSVAHLHSNVWGIYLFSIPLLTGSIENPGNIVVLTDTVTVGGGVKLLTKMSKELKATKTFNMVTTHNTMPFMFGIRQVSVSANVIR